MELLTITDREFRLYQELIYEIAGINLTPAKKALVSHRLAKRLRHHNLKNYQEYFNLITSNSVPGERQIMVDLITTNETFFFREMEHFDFLRDRILADWDSTQMYRIWSAACSSGEEPYSAAMVLEDHPKVRYWEILASDLSTKVLERAKEGIYPVERANKIPSQYLKKYCLKGIRSNEGFFTIRKEVKDRVSFRQINLKSPPQSLGSFDLIFLRNVLIYFDAATKSKFVHNLLPYLRSGGYFFCGHAESLQGMSDQLKSVKPAVYIKK